MKTQTYAVIALLASVLLVSACANTIRGVGKDAASTVNATQMPARELPTPLSEPTFIWRGIRAVACK